VEGSIEAEVRLYDRLFTEPEPEATSDFKSSLNPHSLEIVQARCEVSLADARPDLRYQFERLGYFALDKESSPKHLIFNRTIPLRDSWAKVTQQKRGGVSGVGRVGEQQR
jgi:glutaminyl-tRNA synthetase